MRYWSPNLRSVTRGEWVQFDGERRIAIIREISAGTPPQPLLRDDTWAPVEADRDFLGYFPIDALRLAAEMVWEVYQAALAARKRGACRGVA
ncbi:hypothetical protein ACFVAJ_11175 [Agromyces sp. NPDC057679]|uniref:hypothetical protein n=1 Tax=Agromyces sp. NPDC057679 TaxID=3346207 RepID=UPI00366B8E63